MIWGDRRALAELVRTLGEDPAIGQVLVFYDQPYGLTGAAEESWRAVREGVIAGAARQPGARRWSPRRCPSCSTTTPRGSSPRPASPRRLVCEPGCDAPPRVATGGGDPARLREIAARRATVDRGPRASGWPSTRPRSCCAAHGVAVPRGPGGLGRGRRRRGRCDELGGHVALKLSAATVQHKSELGGVALELRGAEDEVAGAYRRLALLSGAHEGSVLAERMAAPGRRADRGRPHRWRRAGAGARARRHLDRAARRRRDRAAARGRGPDRACAPRAAGRAAAGRRTRRPAAVDLEAAARLAERSASCWSQAFACGRSSCNPVSWSEAGGAVAVDAAISAARGGVAMHDVIVVGGGFAGVTAARECCAPGPHGAAARGPRPARRADVERAAGRERGSSSAAPGCTGISRTRSRSSTRAGLRGESSARCGASRAGM